MPNPNIVDESSCYSYRGPRPLVLRNAENARKAGEGCSCSHRVPVCMHEPGSYCGAEQRERLEDAITAAAGRVTTSLDGAHTLIEAAPATLITAMLAALKTGTS